MSDEEIEFVAGRMPVADVGLDEFDAGFGDFGSGEGAAGAGDHFSALLDAGDLRGGIVLEERDEEAAVAFAEEESGLGVSRLVEKRDAASLEDAAGEEEFHPAVMVGEGIETHADFGFGGRSSARCHQIAARSAPVA